MFLRVQLFTNNANDQAVEDLGFGFAPTGSLQPTGTQDIFIDPPPTVKALPLDSIAFAMEAGMELTANAKSITISHSWVLGRQLEMGYATPEQVFLDPSVVGLVTETTLFSVGKTITNSELFGEVLTWTLRCNAAELSASTVPTSITGG